MPTYGIPDKSNLGSHLDFNPGDLVTYVNSLHDAARAGKHNDLRLGDENLGLLSWAVRKGLPQIGSNDKHLAVQQPIHDFKYKDFQGNIPSGYGKGDVKTEDLGEALITKTTPTSLHFTLAHKQLPERFALIKTNMGKQKNSWILLNTTPNKPLEVGKKRYTSIDPDKAEEIIKNLPQGAGVEPKIDGASNLVHLLKDKIESVSFRASKRRPETPLFHTERIHGKYPTYEQPLPKELENTTLRGELYGSQNDKVIHPSALGGLLNSSISKSLRDQKDKNIELKTMLYDVVNKGKENLDNTSYLDKRKQLESVLPYLPKNKFHISESAQTPQAAQDLFTKIREGQHPLSEEGIVLNLPNKPNPLKAKLRNEYDVHIREMFTAAGKYKDNAVGGFRYSLEPQGPIVGKVGTGFTDDVRKDMFSNPDKYLGNVAKVLSQEQLPSGALRAPAFYSEHLDLPLAPVKQAEYPDIQGKVDPWVQKVMATSFATYPPDKIFTKKPEDIAAAGDLEGVAPKGLLSWQRMVNFHRNRGGLRLPEEHRKNLSDAISLLSSRIKERKLQPEVYDPKTLLSLTKESATIYTGEDSALSKDQLSNMTDSLANNLGVDTKRLAVLQGTKGQFWKDVGRYYNPASTGSYLKSLGRVAVMPVPQRFLPNYTLNLRTLLNSAGNNYSDEPLYGGYHPSFNTISLGKENKNPSTLAHEFGHYVDFQFPDKRVYKKDEDYPFSGGRYTSSGDHETTVNQEIHAWLLANKGLKKETPKHLDLPYLASYIQEHQANLLDGSTFGKTPKETEKDLKIPQDKNWNKNLPKDWNTDQATRDRLLMKALGNILTPDKYDPAGSSYKVVQKPNSKEWIPKWVEILTPRRCKT